MSSATSWRLMRVVSLACVLGATLAAQISNSVSLDFSGRGTGNPNTLDLSGSGTMTPFGAGTVHISSAPDGANSTIVSFTFTFGSAGSFTGVSTSDQYAKLVLSGEARVTGGTGEFASSTGSFSFAISAPPGTTAADVEFTLSGSGSVTSTPQTTSTTLPDAMVGVPYTADIGQSLSQIPPGASFQLETGAGTPPGLTLSSSGVLSGTPAQSGSYTFSVDLRQSAGLIATVAVSINVTASSGPAIAVNPSSLNFSLTQGSSAIATQSVVIANTGSSAQNFTASATPDSGGNWLTVSPATGSVAPFKNGSISVNVDTGSLKAGTYSGTISITTSPGNQQFEVAVLVAVGGGDAQLQISQSGLRFRTVAGEDAPSQAVAILNSGSGALDFSVSTSTTAGGSWLSASPGSGSTAPGSARQVLVTVQPQDLMPGDYYGQVQVSADGASNSPQTISVVLNVAPSGTDLGAFITPTGLIFVGQAGGSEPATQTIAVTTPTPTNLTFTANTFFTQGNNWVTVQPASGNLNAANPLQLSVQPAISKLDVGVYFADIVLHFNEDNTTRHIAVVAIVIPGVPARNTEAAAASTCVATRLIPVFTQLGSNFTTVAAWPTPVEVTIVDDCGNFMTVGNVTASFSDGDPSLPLTSLNDGRWSATWQPRNASAQVVITVDAAELAPPIEGTQNIGGALQTNPVTPSVNPGGVVSAAKSAKNQPLAPGAFASIYGTHLSVGQNPALSLPLATQLGATQVLLAGRTLPLQYTADGQVNAVIPYDIPPNSSQQLIVTNGPALSVPETVLIAPAQPAVFAQADGTGVVFDVKPGQTNQVLVDASHPVSAGDAIVIYCAGLGPVNPPVAAGSAAPFSPPATTVNPVSVTIGGKTAQVFFGGLVGGFAGLYQVNAYIPDGIAPGSAVPLIVTVAGFDSAPVTLAVK